jgi:Putative auto-transporter adhesin, head GIN domain
MNNYFKLGVATAAFCTMIGAAVAAPDEIVTETRAIDARVVRVKLDGVIDLKLRQGAVPMLVLSGDKRYLSKTTTIQNGDTINIGTETRGFNLKMGRHSGVRAELTLPQLREVTSESVGSTEISGFSGDELELGLDGAGAMKVVSNYRVVTATLGGVGSMNIQGTDSEGIDLNLRGAGYVTLSGRSKWLKASLGGLGGLDAQHLQVDTVNLDMSGLGNATVTARQSASLDLSGLGSVTVYGKPLNRKVSVDGLGKVSWK